MEHLPGLTALTCLNHVRKCVSGACARGPLLQERLDTGEGTKVVLNRRNPAAIRVGTPLAAAAHPAPSMKHPHQRHAGLIPEVLDQPSDNGTHRVEH